MESIYSEPTIAVFREKIESWANSLEENPDWRNFNRKKILYTLNYDIYDDNDDRLGFLFDEQTRKEHEFVMCSMELILCMNAIMKCEYYFVGTPSKDCR